MKTRKQYILEEIEKLKELPRTDYIQSKINDLYNQLGNSYENNTFL